MDVTNGIRDIFDGKKKLLQNLLGEIEWERYWLGVCGRQVLQGHDTYDYDITMYYLIA